jgi:hypothetical protein
MMACACKGLSGRWTALQVDREALATVAFADSIKDKGGFEPEEIVKGLRKDEVKDLCRNCHLSLAYGIDMPLGCAVSATLRELQRCYPNRPPWQGI